MKILRLKPCFIALTAISLASNAQAQTATTSTNESSITAPIVTDFERADSLLSAKKGIVADFEITTTYAVPYKDTKEGGTVYIAHPNLVRINIDRFRRVLEGKPWEATGNGSVVVTNGKQQYRVTLHPKSSQYEGRPAHLQSARDALTALWPLSAFFNTDLPASSRILAPQSGSGDSNDSIVTTENGETFTSRSIAHPGGKITYYFGSDGLIRRIITEFAPQADYRMPGETYSRREVRFSHLRDLAENDTTQFAYTPPTDSVKITIPKATAFTDTTLRSPGVGDTAPEIIAEDYAGKTVKLSDFAGKSVLVKFWATWCWPCRQSLPETEALAKNDNVIVFAVALWDSRKAFRDFVAKYAADQHTTPDKLKIHFAFDPRPMGQDAGSSLYHIKATPTQIVVGRDGKITHVSTGYNGPSKELASAVANTR